MIRLRHRRRRLRYGRPGDGTQPDLRSSRDEAWLRRTLVEYPLRQVDYYHFPVSDDRIFARCWRAEAYLSGKKDPHRFYSYSGISGLWNWVAEFKRQSKRTYRGSAFRVTERMKTWASIDWVHYQCLKMLEEFKKGRLRRHLRSRNRAHDRALKFEFTAENYVGTRTGRHA